MQQKAQEVREELAKLGVTVGGSRRVWCERQPILAVAVRAALACEDRDIVAVHCERGMLLIAEVEGDSTGQPETKVYKAAGQLICGIGVLQTLVY
jgi:hypothetical protein